MDFIRGASRSKGGKPIIAMPATAKNGELSRIVPMLDPGAGVVTSRGAVHYVVTEFGVAYLHGDYPATRRSADRDCPPQIPRRTVRLLRENTVAATPRSSGEVSHGTSTRQSQIDTEECKGCGVCVDACPPKCLLLLPGLNPYGVHPAHYTGELHRLRNLLLRCPEPGAITVYRLIRRKRRSRRWREAMRQLCKGNVAVVKGAMLRAAGRITVTRLRRPARSPKRPRNTFRKSAARSCRRKAKSPPSTWSTAQRPRDCGS